MPLHRILSERGQAQRYPNTPQTYNIGVIHTPPLNYDNVFPSLNRLQRTCGGHVCSVHDWWTRTLLNGRGKWAESGPQSGALTASLADRVQLILSSNNSMSERNRNRRAGMMSGFSRAGTIPATRRSALDSFDGRLLRSCETLAGVVVGRRRSLCRMNGPWARISHCTTLTGQRARQGVPEKTTVLSR